MSPTVCGLCHLTQVAGPHFEALCRAFALVSGAEFCSGAGFTAELTTAASEDDHILLVGLDRLYQ